MFKSKSYLTRILQFMYENPRSFYTIEGFQKFLPDFDQLTIRNHIESLEKDGLAEGRKVWKAAMQTDELNVNAQEQVKGYKLTPRGLAFVKNRKQKNFVMKAAVAGITITSLALTAIIGIEYFQSLVAEKSLPSKQAIPVLVGDTLTTKSKSGKPEPSYPDTRLPEN
jgi:hypothetical protein